MGRSIFECSVGLLDFTGASGTKLDVDWPRGVEKASSLFACAAVKVNVDRIIPCRNSFIIMLSLIK